MQNLARLLISLREAVNDENAQLSQFLRPDKFDVLIQCVMQISKFYVKRGEKEVGTPSLALHIGHTKAIQFSNTFRYIDDLFSNNNVDFGNYISAIYPPELQLPHLLLKCVISTHISRQAIQPHLSVSATIREMTLQSGLSTFLIWIATFPPIQLTVFIYLNW